MMPDYPLLGQNPQTRSAELNAHDLDTTLVHGIADTSLLMTGASVAAAEFYGNALAGVETMPRNFVIGSATMTSGAVRLAYFTPQVSYTASTIITATASTAAAATPTLCRMGLYAVAANGDLTLVASCANDTALWAATTTEYSRALVSPATYTLIAGIRYAAGAICISASAVPTLIGSSGSNSALLGRAPVLCKSIGGQTDLPASQVVAGLSATAQLIYVALV
jgi:hypothetical protein